MFDCIKKWFTELLRSKQRESVFDFTFFPKEDMNKYTFAETAEMQALAMGGACAPIILAIVLDNKKICIDFTGGAYSSRFLQKMAYGISNGVVKWYSEKQTGYAIPKTALKNLKIINSEDPSIVVEFEEYMTEATALYIASHYGVIT